MKNKFLASVVVVALVAIVFIVSNSNNGGDSAFAQPAGAAVTTWEYRIVATGFGRIGGQEREFNQLGSEGWELVSVAGDSMGAVVVFKRPSR